MSNSGSEEIVKLAILSIVTGVWAIAFLFDVINPNFEVPIIVHTIMGAVIGYFTTSRIGRRKSNGN